MATLGHSAVVEQNRIGKRSHCQKQNNDIFQRGDTLAWAEERGEGHGLRSAGDSLVPKNNVGVTACSSHFCFSREGFFFIFPAQNLEVIHYCARKVV